MICPARQGGLWDKNRNKQAQDTVYHRRLRLTEEAGRQKPHGVPGVPDYYGDGGRKGMEHELGAQSS